MKITQFALIWSVVIALVAVVGYYAVYRIKSDKFDQYCQSSSASWQGKEQCKQQEGHWVAPDAVCKNEKWLGEKADPKDVCCVACTDDTIADQG